MPPPFACGETVVAEDTRSRPRGVHSRDGAEPHQESGLPHGLLLRHRPLPHYSFLFLSTHPQILMPPPIKYHALTCHILLPLSFSLIPSFVRVSSPCLATPYNISLFPLESSFQVIMGRVSTGHLDSLLHMNSISWNSCVLFPKQRRSLCPSLNSCTLDVFLFALLVDGMRVRH